ncbi:MAG: hypothetical protein IPJ59_30210 [Nannocystis sp.]|nr:hypothetical protein [Nannocystis sp.]MBK7829438.1 hypothetical protein [Nannocystis sp.]
MAGLTPALVEGGFDVWRPIRVNFDPAGLADLPAETNRYVLSVLLSLEEELPADRRRNPAELARMDLRTYVTTRPRRKGRQDLPAVLLFDQFEEVLTVGPPGLAERRAFFSAVGQALEGGELWALFIVREDHLPALAPYRDRIPTELANTFRLDLLDRREGAREAAVRLAERGGRAFPGVDRLVQDLATVQVQQADGSIVAEPGPFVEPVQLQVVCHRLWAAMPDDDLSIDAEDIERYASVSSALAGYYADVVAAVAGGDEAVERAVREWVGRTLIVNRLRAQVRQEARQSAGLGNDLIARLRDQFIVRAEPRAGGTWFELSHDRLVEPVLRDNEAWEAKHLHPLQVQARLWEDGRRPAALLLGAAALRGAQAWAAEHPKRITGSERDSSGCRTGMCPGAGGAAPTRRWRWSRWWSRWASGCSRCWRCGPRRRPRPRRRPPRPRRRPPRPRRNNSRRRKPQQTRPATMRRRKPHGRARPP